MTGDILLGQGNNARRSRMRITVGKGAFNPHDRGLARIREMPGWPCPEMSKPQPRKLRDDQLEYYDSSPTKESTKHKYAKLC